ncbi:hypothetical protein ABGI61_14860 [Rheinheimera sp. FR7-31]|uniref:hypothetical protein n=1 Tax=Rheinheimera fenheensis TaxID=3152295 RepID=UPI00325E8AA7
MSKFLILLSLLVPFGVIATIQIPDKFIADGITHDIESTPLEDLFSHDQILLMLQRDGWCSDNWRGYKAVWELSDGTLYLNSLVKNACDENPESVDPVHFFGESEFPIKATWVNSVIEVKKSEIRSVTKELPNGDKEYVGYDYDAVVFEFSGGKLVQKLEKTIKNRRY